MSWNSASMLSSSRPARRALASQPRQRLAERAVGGERPVAQGGRDEGADPRPRRHEPGVFEFLVGLQHRVRIDRQALDDLLDRRELVALFEQAEPQGLAYLPDDLLVRARRPSGRPSGTRSLTLRYI